MRFHLAVTFLPVDEIGPCPRPATSMGYSGSTSPTTCSTPGSSSRGTPTRRHPTGLPFWEKETEWPDPMCLISALAAVTTNLTFTTGIYIAPVRDLITVAKSVGTAAVLSHNRVRLGVGVGWCKEEYIQTGQDFHSRGKRLNDMIPALRALWQGGWVEYHGTHYDVPTLPDEPGAHPAGPDPGRRGLRGGPETGLHPVRRLDQHRGRASRRGLRPGRAGSGTRSSGPVGRTTPFAIYLAVKAFPDLDLYRRLEDAGVTDLLCAPWMAVEAEDGDTPGVAPGPNGSAMCEQFAEHIIAALAVSVVRLSADRAGDRRSLTVRH